MAKRHEFTNEEIKLIHDMYYNNNETLKDIAKKLNVSATCIRNYFLYNNLEIHERVYKRKYDINEHIFDKIDTPDKAYCLGFFYSDGYNDEEDGSIRIELHLRDIDILEKINSFIGSNKPIKIHNANSDTKHNTPSCELCINSRYMSNVLTNYGFVQRKSLILEFPYWMDKELIPFMLKGYIDGDGWVQRYNIGIMSTEMFCQGVHDYLEEININSSIYNQNPNKYKEVTKTLYIHRRNNIKRLVKYMFSYGTLFLQRKYDKYIEHGFLDNINNSIVV